MTTTAGPTTPHERPRARRACRWSRSWPRIAASLGLGALASLAPAWILAQTRVETTAGAVVTSAQASPAAGNVERGRSVYVKFGCYQCHGREAQGGSAGPRLGPGPRPYEEFAEYTREPTGDMPPYTTKILTDADLRDMYAFVASRPAPSGRPALLKSR